MFDDCIVCALRPVFAAASVLWCLQMLPSVGLFGSSPGWLGRGSVVHTVTAVVLRQHTRAHTHTQMDAHAHSL